MPHRYLRRIAACVLLAGCTPPGPTPPATTTAAPGPFDGTYNGIMTAVPGHSIGCRPSLQVTNMHVEGGRVTLNSFTGMIGRDGQLQMRSQFEWIMGQFTGTTFIGTLTPQYAGCEYRMEMQRAGS